VAWWRWVQHGDESLTNRRRALTTVGLALVSFGVLTYVLFDVQTSRIHSWFNHQDEMFIWIRAGGWTAVLGLVCSLLGAGRSRVWGALSGLLVAALWFFIAAVPP
jgi:hypothetical protein